ncbi:MAG: uroporphyrinogen decarboxylase family protein [Candidatus Bathyarchaeia archaeon]
MNSKERMLAALNCEEPDVVPVAPHWWGVYKFEFYGRDPRWAWYALDGCQLAKIDINFYEHFKPDWFHLDGGVARNGENYQIEEKDGQLFLVHKLTGVKREIFADQSLGPVVNDRGNPLRLETRGDVDEFIENVRTKCEDLIEKGYTDHIQEIVKRYGDEVLIAVNVGGPSGIIYAEGFVEGLTGLFRKPDVMKYLIKRAYEIHIEIAQAYTSAGCHAYIASEDRIGADIISPEMYKEFFLESQKKYYHEIRKMGMIPISYYCGNVMPLLKYLKDLDIDGLMIEESRKNFSIDIFKVKEALEGKICVFGNINTVSTLLLGSKERILREIKEQLQAAPGGGFIAANGSPLAPGTPVENVEFFIKSVRKYGRYPRI